MSTITKESAKERVGKGWGLLIEAIYSCMPEGVEVQQVKEKFAGLRFYYTGGTEAFRDVVDRCEAASFHTCEQCGYPGKVVNAPNSSWLLTLCHACYAEEHVRRLSEGSKEIKV